MLNKCLTLLLVVILIIFNVAIIYMGYYYNNLVLGIVLALLGTILSLIFWWC